MGSQNDNLPPIHVGLLRLALKAIFIVVGVLAIHALMEWATELADTAENQGLMIGVFTFLLLSYALLIAVPFMPGIEIGISLLMLKGAAIAPLVYLATVLGLLIAFVAGRFLPYAWLHGLLADLRLKRAGDLVERLSPMSRQDRLTYLSERIPPRFRFVITSGRYLGLAVLLNLPGNALIGGGGGIVFIAGFSRLYRPALTLIVIALAVLPVPLAVYIGGHVFMR